LKEQIRVREAEISRVGSLLEIERGSAAGYRRKLGGDLADQSFSVGRGSTNRAEQLEMQVDYLHETISELEKVN
jgi:hypothetical protein